MYLSLGPTCYPTQVILKIFYQLNMLMTVPSAVPLTFILPTFSVWRQNPLQFEVEVQRRKSDDVRYWSQQHWEQDSASVSDPSDPRRSPQWLLHQDGQTCNAVCNSSTTLKHHHWGRTRLTVRSLLSHCEDVVPLTIKRLKKEFKIK